MVTAALSQLEERVRQVERRGEGRGVALPGSEASEAVDWGQALAGAVRWPRGAVHEWFAQGGPPVGVVGHLVQAARAAEGGVVVWVGRSCWPYPARLGRDAGLFVDSDGAADRLWAIELCARSHAVSAVVADGRGLDMTATRRLQLAARDGDGRVMLMRPGRERDQLSAAAVRWLVEPAASPTGHPRWSVELLRCKGLPSRKFSPLADTLRVGSRWALEYSDAGLVPVPADVVDRPAAAASLKIA